MAAQLAEDQSNSPPRSAHQLVERLHARAVGVRPQVRLVEQHAAQAGVARADHVDVIQVADVDRRVLRGAALLQRDLEEPRVRLLDAFVGANPARRRTARVMPSRSRCARSVPLAFETTTIRRPRARSA